MDNLKKGIYKKYSLFFYNKSFKKLGENIINDNVEVIEEIKVTDRNYVAKIKYNGNYYILKSPRNEHIKIQRKIMTLFKKGEALSTLVNTNRLIGEGLDFFAAPYLAVVRRKDGMIVESYFVTEYFQEKKREKLKKEELNNWLKLVEKLHAKRICHGDFNPSNIIDTDNGVKLIDSQCKHYYFGEYRSNYDKLTLEYSAYGTLGRQNWYKRDIWYKLALYIKSMRNGGEKI